MSSDSDSWLEEKDWENDLDFFGEGDGGPVQEVDVAAGINAQHAPRRIIRDSYDVQINPNNDEGFNSTNVGQWDSSNNSKCGGQSMDDQADSSGGSFVIASFSHECNTGKNFVSDNLG